MTHIDRPGTCLAEKHGYRCIKFPGHPGRCRFMRTYTERQHREWLALQRHQPQRQP
jgi:hypothetical protein